MGWSGGWLRANKYNVYTFLDLLCPHPFIIVYIIVYIWISIYGYPYMDIHIWISIYGYPYMDIHIHIWISIYGYPYMDMDIHIRISIYGYPYMDITTYMLFGHETSFILRYRHQSGTIRIRKPFSIILDDQNQVPIGPNRGL